MRFLVLVRMCKLSAPSRVCTRLDLSESPLTDRTSHYARIRRLYALRNAHGKAAAARDTIG